MRPNALKAKFARGEAAFGVNLMFPSVQLVETFGLLGFDWVLLDCEHGAISFESLDALTMAADAAGITPIVRPPNNDDASILRALDRGAHGIQVPHVDTADDARRAVAAARYHPFGERGLAPGTRATGYGVDFNAAQFVEHSNREVLVVVQIEHRNALANLDEIVRVEGVDVFFVGPMDLSLSLGHPGKLDEPAVREAIERCFATIQGEGKIAGSSGGPADVRRFRQLGGQYLYTHFHGLLAEGVRRFRGVIDEPVAPGLQDFIVDVGDGSSRGG
jgi:4-hydroxy-2-oxoheptanedioate aldolase